MIDDDLNHGNTKQGTAILVPTIIYSFGPNVSQTPEMTTTPNQEIQTTEYFIKKSSVHFLALEFENH